MHRSDKETSTGVRLSRWTVSLRVGNVLAHTLMTITFLPLLGLGITLLAVGSLVRRLHHLTPPSGARRPVVRPHGRPLPVRSLASWRQRT